MGFCKTIFKHLFLIFNLIFCLSSFADVPDASKVFHCLVTQKQGKIFIQWDIAPNHFLYKDRLQIQINQHSIIHEVNWPKTTPHTDRLGRIQAIYQKQLTLAIPYPESQKSIQLNLQYQGCSESGICYPPQQMTKKLTAPEMQSLIWTLLSFLGLGILLAFTPCVLPMLPILTKVVMGEHQSTQKVIGLGTAYIIGMASSYALVGAIIAHLGKNLFIVMQNPYVLSGFALLFIFLGLSTLGVIHLAIPQKFQAKTLNFRSRLQHGRYVSAWLMGCLSILVLSPCITAPMLGALAYITQLGEVWKGSLCLFMLGLGMGLPLLIFALSAGHWLPKAGTWMENIKICLAILLFAVATLLIHRVANSFWQNTSVSLLALTSIYLIRPQSLHARYSNIIRISISTIIILLTSFYLMTSKTAESKDAPIQQTKVIENQIQRSSKPVILYFSAKWCLTCQYIEKNVLSNQELSPLFKNNEWIKIDLTNQTPDNQDLMKKFNVVAPPAVLRIKEHHIEEFFGEEINVQRLKNWNH